MGPGLGGAGTYDSAAPTRPAAVRSLRRLACQAAAVSERSASSQEWRTPPLWGIRDSGPYLHDGRATTLEQAIAIHGGEGEESAQAFAALEPKEKAMLMTFLKSLVAPTISMARRDLP